MGMPPPSSRSQPPRTQGTAYNMQSAPQQAAPQSASEWLGSTAGKDFLRNNPTYQAPATPPPAPAYQRPATAQPYGNDVYTPPKPQTTGFINPSVGPQPRQGWGDAFPYGQPIDAPLPPYAPFVPTGPQAYGPSGGRPFHGEPKTSTPQTPPGGWMYNKTNSTPAFNPVLPTPTPAPPKPGQAQSAPPPASGNRIGGWPDAQANNVTQTYMPYPNEPRGVPSFGPGSQPVPSPTRDSAPGDQAGDSNRKAWEAAGRPGLPTDRGFAQVIGQAKDGTAFGTQTEATFYDKWRASGGQTSAPSPPQYGPQQAAQPQAPQAAALAASASPRPPAPSLRTADRYTRPEGYVPNSTLWAQHAPTPEPEPAPYNPNPPQAPKANVFPEMQRGPSASYLSNPGYSTQATWDQSHGKMGQASYNGAMTMNANMANPGGESLRPPGFTFNAQGVDGKQYANPADAIAKRDALIASLGQQQARYSGSMGRNLGAP